jgi:hypothetical protein
VVGHRAVLLPEAFGNSKSPATACVIGICYSLKI